MFQALQEAERKVELRPQFPMSLIPYQMVRHILSLSSYFYPPYPLQQQTGGNAGVLLGTPLQAPKFREDSGPCPRFACGKMGHLKCAPKSLDAELEKITPYNTRDIYRPHRL